MSDLWGNVVIVYLAAPIDGVGEGDRPALVTTRDEAHEKIRDNGMAVYDPYKAVTGGSADPKGMYDINEMALARCDGLIALWPHGVQSMGVPMEIQSAHNLGKPVGVLGGHSSMQLKAMEIHCFWTVCDAAHYVREQIEVQSYKLGTSFVRGGRVLYSEGAEYRGDGGQPSRTIRWIGDPECGPTRTYIGDAGWDLTVAEDARIPVDGFHDVSHGICVELPSNTWALITGRSSTIRKRGLLVVNGIIDNGYRGPLFAAVQNLSGEVVELKRGERIAQLIPFPLVSDRLDVEPAEELSETVRGQNAFGSTGGFAATDH